MRIQTRLIAYFLGVATLVPAVGSVAFNSVRSVDNSVGDLNERAIPRVRAAEQLSALQRDQQIAALTYATGGKPEDRRHYLDLTGQFDEQMNRLRASDSSSEGKEIVTKIDEQHTAFNRTASRLLSSRDITDRNAQTLRARETEMVQELERIRRRYGGTSGNPADVTTIPANLRNQINDLFLATEAMLHMVSMESAAATGYAVSPDDKLQAQLDQANTLFSSALTLAINSGGTDDRAILQNVQAKYREFDASAREMVNAANVSTQARITFPEMSSAIGGLINGYLNRQTELMTQAGRSSADTASGGKGTIIVFTLAAFVIAGGLGWVFATSITRPIRQLRDVADRVSQGDVSDADIDIDARGEIADLADSFRRMVASVRFLMLRGDETEDGEEDFFSTSTHAA